MQANEALASIVRSISRSQRITATVRVAAGTFVVAAIGYAYSLSIAEGFPNPLNFFGYFTNLTSSITALLLIITGVLTLRSSSLPAWLPSLRAITVTCMLIVGVIYNLLVPGTGNAPPWVSLTLHVLFPLFVAIDWVLGHGNTALPWRRLWIVLPYPLTWLAVVLVRGITDGWVPYGFLLPERGISSLLAHVAGLLIALLLAGAAVWSTSRLPAMRSNPPGQRTRRR